MQVRMISGAYGLHQGGSVVLVRRNEVCDVDNEEGERLIAEGIAERINGAVATPPVAQETIKTSENTPAPETTAESDFSGYSMDTPVSELRKIAKDNGITFKVGTTKEEMVRTLDEFFSAPTLGAEEFIR